MPSQTYDYLNKAWKSACKVLFGEEIGELESYRDWLCQYVTMPRDETSAASGKRVTVAASDYASGAKFLGFEEADFGKKFQPLSINEVKDIDSIVQAIGERLYYAGNIILGSSKFVEGSSNVVDSHYVLDSSIVSDSKYIAYSYMTRKCGHMFGVHGDAESEFIIKGSDGHKGKRQFECFTNLVCSDSYYCMRCQDCRELFFCFGLRSKSYCIGNMPLPKEKYAAIKSKLLSEIAGKLRKDHQIFSLLELVQEARKHPPEIQLPPAKGEEQGDMKPMEEAFSKTSSLLLGKELHGIDSYAIFLKRHVRQRIVYSSPFSGKKAYLAGFATNLAKHYKIGGSFVTEDEMIEIGKISLGEKFASAARMDLCFLADNLHPIAYSAMNDQVGKSHNIIDCALVLHSEDCYRTDGATYSKKCAYNFWPRESEHIFGSWAVWESSFCMKAYNSKKLTRCFEADICESCSDLYFAHNCENVQDSMFCFNAKNLRNAIGNAEMEREKYRSAKSLLLSQLADELEKKKTLKWDIYSLGASR